MIGLKIGNEDIQSSLLGHQLPPYLIDVISISCSLFPFFKIYYTYTDYTHRTMKKQKFFKLVIQIIIDIPYQMSMLVLPTVMILLLGYIFPSHVFVCLLIKVAIEIFIIFVINPMTMSRPIVKLDCWHHMFMYFYMYSYQSYRQDEVGLAIKKFTLLYNIGFVTVFTSCFFGLSLLDTVVTRNTSSNGTFLKNYCVFLFYFMITSYSLAIITSTLQLYGKTWFSCFQRSFQVKISSKNRENLNLGQVRVMTQLALKEKDHPKTNTSKTWLLGEQLEFFKEL